MHVHAVVHMERTCCLFKDTAMRSTLLDQKWWACLATMSDMHNIQQLGQQPTPDVKAAGLLVTGRLPLCTASNSTCCMTQGLNLQD